MILSVTAARAAAAAGKTEEAATTLKATLADATKAALVPSQLEARLALGEVEIRSGNAAAGTARLQAVEKDAAAKSFRLIARRAAAARLPSK